jgi:BA14K-like protein
MSIIDQDQSAATRTVFISRKRSLSGRNVMLKSGVLCAAVIVAAAGFIGDAQARSWSSGGARAGGFSGARMGGANFSGARVGGMSGARWSGASMGGARFSGARVGGPAMGARIAGAGVAGSGARWAGGNWQGGRWAGGNWNGGRWNGGRWHGGRWWPYAAVGVGIGLAAWPYYGGGYYDDYYPYVDDTYVDPGYVENGYGGGDVAYCIRTFRTYDVQSGTYVGKGGRRIACP